MAAGVKVLVITTHVRVLQPMHPHTEVTVLFREDDQVKMVGHEAVAKDWHGDFDTGVVEGLEEGVVITLLVKNLPAPLAAV